MRQLKNGILIAIPLPFPSPALMERSNKTPNIYF